MTFKALSFKTETEMGSATAAPPPPNPPLASRLILDLAM